MSNSCTIDIFASGQWIKAMDLTLVSPEKRGHENAPVRFGYDLDYAFEHLGRNDSAAVSVHLPVDVADRHLPSWPPFLLDLLPTGAGRRRLCQQLGVPDDASADWELLCRAGGPPPGNLRIRPRPESTDLAAPVGFSRADVVSRAEGFVGYCHTQGYPLGGSSAVQGESPKILLSEDGQGQFHPSGTLAAPWVRQEWLVKFPRGRTVMDRDILRAEAVYYDVARRLGCSTGKPLVWEADCLFVPRFDVVCSDAGVQQRRGLESMASVLGRTGFGQSADLHEFAAAIRAFSTAPADDLVELLRRDVLNVAFGNTDNHSRNTAWVKDPGTVRLAPLFDFAPMMVDPEWITRACRWGHHDNSGFPHWRTIARELAANAAELNQFQAELNRLQTLVSLIPRWLAEAEVAALIVERCAERCHRTLEGLADGA